jgi:hypothetical protein
MKHKSFASIPSFGDLSFAQVAFNYCEGCASMAGSRMNKSSTISAFATAYIIFTRYHKLALWVEQARNDKGRFVARTIDESCPERKFARSAFAYLATQMQNIRRRDREAKRLTRTQWLVYMQDAFDIFSGNPHARSMAQQEERSRRDRRDSEYRHTDDVLEAAAQRNSLNEWADRRTNYGSGNRKFVVTQKFVNENS